MGDEDQVMGPDGPSIAEIGQAPAEPETVPDAQSISRMMDLTGLSALHDRNITGKGVTIALLDSQFYYDNETARKLASDIVPIYNGSYRKYEVHGIACAELISEIG